MQSAVVGVRIDDEGRRWSKLGNGATIGVKTISDQLKHLVINSRLRHR